VQVELSAMRILFARCGYLLSGMVFHGRSVHLTWRAICVYNGERFNLSDMMRRTRWNVRRVQYGRAD
jgi:hypothetical protein